MDYYSQGKYIHIDREALDIVDLYITERANFGFILGPTSGGKSTLAKYIAEKFQYTLIEWEPLFEMLKVKLGTEDSPLEEVTFA